MRHGEAHTQRGYKRYITLGDSCTPWYVGRTAVWRGGRGAPDRRQQSLVPKCLLAPAHDVARDDPAVSRRSGDGLHGLRRVLRHEGHQEHRPRARGRGDDRGPRNRDHQRNLGGLVQDQERGLPRLRLGRLSGESGADERLNVEGLAVSNPLDAAERAMRRLYFDADDAETLICEFHAPFTEFEQRRGSFSSEFIWFFLIIDHLLRGAYTP